MAVGSNKKSSNQPDHETWKYKTKSKGGVPIYQWVHTIVKDGKFTVAWHDKKLAA